MQNIQMQRTFVMLQSALPETAALSVPTTASAAVA